MTYHPESFREWTYQWDRRDSALTSRYEQRLCRFATARRSRWFCQAAVAALVSSSPEQTRGWRERAKKWSSMQSKQIGPNCCWQYFDWSEHHTEFLFQWQQEEFLPCRKYIVPCYRFHSASCYRRHHIPLERFHGHCISLRARVMWKCFLQVQEKPRTSRRMPIGIESLLSFRVWRQPYR